MRMAVMPRPVSPRSALADLKLMFAPDRPHRWGLLGVSAAITGIVVWGILDSSVAPPPERQIIYVESWMSDRKDSDIIRKQKIELLDYEAELEEKKRRYQVVADMSGIEWREAEAKERAQRKIVIAAIQKQLDQRLAAALQREALAKAASENPVP